MNETLVDFFRCPEASFNFALSGDLSRESGYFSFGADTVCYGRSCAGPRTNVADGALADLSHDVTYSGSTLRLPFDPADIVENFRRERYTANGHAGNARFLSSALARRLYYFVRPALHVSVRKHLQRYFFRDLPRLSFPRWPVDTSVETLLERLLCLSIKAQNLKRIPFIWFWPEGAASCVTVTHDVETKAGLRFCSRLMDVDDRFGVKSSFQVIPEEQYPVSQQFITEVRDRGFELNIQDLNHEGNLFSDRKQFLLHAAKINKYAQQYEALGFRSGRMYRNADWYDALNITYDMSIPNVAHLEPQRGGSCTVFPYFIGNILEIPLTTSQDYTVFNILSDYSNALWKAQIALITKAHGLLTFIVHPDYLLEKRALKAYIGLLDRLAALHRDENAWIAPPREVNRWWRQRSEMKLVSENGQWRITGPGQARARIAYATVKDDRIEYSVEQNGPRGAMAATTGLPLFFDLEKCAQV